MKSLENLKIWTPLTRVIFVHLKKSYRLKLQNFFIGFADQVKAPTPVFPSREDKSEDEQPIGGWPHLAKHVCKVAWNKRKNTVRKTGFN